ncbi:hypothetical protein F511_05344 [Dorcoceras hygrometricum]|uniref:BZIP domain-containing protein n=1 Tax=Dorcoceras hygrometricum TaxID=472368 RepID=A0A2Z7AU30_9LAMI|nr:hypothetical protein F511_05344 [Dorcoceras hygrometricum]
MMANSRGPSSIRSVMYSGKNTLLPPKSPYPSISSGYTDYVPASATGPKAPPRPREGNAHHQRTSSESYLIEEQPSWLDELLNEPETPVRRGGHRRSSSDSFAYLDTNSVGSMNYAPQNDNKTNNISLVPSWGSHEFDAYADMRHGSFFVDPQPPAKTKNRVWNTPVSSILSPHGHPSRDKTLVPNVGVLSTSQDSEWNPSFLYENRDAVKSGIQDPKDSSEKKETSQAKLPASETDTKRAKQQFAQRSRVRKLQYIAELERNVQALQASSGVSAELEFLNQQHLILSMENKALKQRLDSLAQEQLIKYMEHEVLEREVRRLRTLYQQQHQPQQQQQTPSSHRRANSRDLDQQFANLSLKYKEASPGRDSGSSQLHI